MLNDNIERMCTGEFKVDIEKQKDRAIRRIQKIYQLRLQQLGIKENEANEQESQTEPEEY